MAVMVTLIVLSAMGINIGPLLEGTGVAGLAIGFGAQKLVADVLFGIFCLIDDAFRVGEYIQAGSVSGTVEAITLRNVMLRHYRGMLQIIPLSDLGSITNFTRGGIVVKFSLQFPCDTDIDKVRKAIKKVGKKMFDDPEMGPIFYSTGQIRSPGAKSVSRNRPFRISLRTCSPHPSNGRLILIEYCEEIDPSYCHTDILSQKRRSK